MKRKQPFLIFIFFKHLSYSKEIAPRNSHRSVVTFDMNWRSYDERSQMVFETLFPGVMEQEEFQMNVSKLFSSSNINPLILGEHNQRTRR